jgi:hypothetical protein
MKIRLEFTRPRVSSNYDWIVRLARQQPGYAALRGGRLRVHRVDFKDGEIPAFLAIFERIAGWKTAAVWINDQLVGRAEAFNRILEHHRIGRSRGHRIYTELMAQIRRDGTGL